MRAWPKKWIVSFAVALSVAAFAAPFASSSPDGLVRVAQDTGFLAKGTSYISSPAPNYNMPGIDNSGVARAAAGITGTLVTFGIMFGFTKLVVARRRNSGESA